MQTITFSELRTHAAQLKEALKRGETVELASHGQVIASIHPVKDVAVSSDHRKIALEAFMDVFKDDESDKKLAQIREGRKGRAHAF